ncbi:MAG: YdcF family protein [Patescibacteria group bacterium]|nr:YdcF family protein [Patescibacteria group bacterium]
MAAVFLFVCLALLNFNFEEKNTSVIFSEIEKLPQAQAVLILGASVYENRILSDVLKERTDAAIEIYQAQKAKYILVSGDNRNKNYNETVAVYNYLLEKQIAKQDIFLDFAGLNTYDSLFRAKKVFQAKSLIIPTQKLYLPRALFLAKGLGIEAYGLPVDKTTYQPKPAAYLREKAAAFKAFFDIYFKPQPKFLGKPLPLPD